MNEVAIIEKELPQKGVHTKEEKERYDKLLQGVKESLIMLVANLKAIRDEGLYFKVASCNTFDEFLAKFCPIRQVDAKFFLDTVDTFGHFKAIDLAKEHRQIVTKVINDKKDIKDIEYSEKSNGFLVYLFRQDAPILFDEYVKQYIAEANPKTVQKQNDDLHQEKSVINAKSLVNGAITALSLNFKKIREVSLELEDRTKIHPEINLLYTNLQNYCSELSDNFPDAFTEVYKKMSSLAELDPLHSQYNNDYVGKFFKCIKTVEDDIYSHQEGDVILVELIEKEDDEKYKVSCYLNGESESFEMPLTNLQDYYALLVNQKEIKEAKKTFKNFKNIYRK